MLLLILIAAVAGGYQYWRHQDLYPSTDDAYLNAHVVRIASEVSGRVTQLPVKDHEHVEEGQLLLAIDPAPFRLALEQAEAELDLAKQEAAAAEAAVVAARAKVAEREAALQNVQASTGRTLRLVAKGTMPKAQADDAHTALTEAQAALSAARAELQQALSQLGPRGADNARMRAAAAALAEAKLNLAHTRIVAAATGVLGEIQVRPGAMIAMGQALFPLVEDDSYWVDANYKETSLARIAPGQPAAITLDIYPDKTFRGVVDSVSPATGTAFSLLPPENATGNWVKVTQRFPVRVRITDASTGHPLRIGASASVTIDTTAAHDPANN